MLLINSSPEDQTSKSSLNLLVFLNFNKSGLSFTSKDEFNSSGQEKLSGRTRRDQGETGIIRKWSWPWSSVYFILLYFTFPLPRERFESITFRAFLVI